VGSGSATTRFGGGILQPSDTKLWDAFYPTGDPVRIALQQTFRVADFMGEWGLGFSGSLQFHQGKVPATLPGGEGVAGAVAGRKISYYSTGLYFSTDYRFRYMPNPPVTPRFMVSLGGERLRETEAVATAQDSSKNEGSERTGKFGYTLLKPMVLAGAALEFSFGALFGKSFQSTALGYGARDVMLGLDALMSFDLSDHKFTQNGLLLGGSIVLLLE
jgi:hypothetical protein